MKKILLILGHPDPESYNHALFQAYLKGANEGAHELKTIQIAELNFQPNLAYGYRKRTELEPDLLDAQAKIAWADHLVWVYPVWWGGVPALMKGFIDRVFLPGFAFQKRENSLMVDPLFKGKTARIICTMDQPNWYYRLVYRQPSHQMMRRTVLEFCGIKPVKITAIGPIRLSKEAYRIGFLQKIEALGRQGF